MQENKPRKGRGAVTALVVINLLLAAALSIAIILTITDGLELAWPAVPAGADADTALSADGEEEAAAPEEDRSQWIDPDKLKYYSQEFFVSTEFLQQFFPENIIYKDAGEIVYMDIDPELPRHSYDWTKLIRSGGRLDYVAAGESQALAGIDVSSHQGEIDWAKVAADGIEFAMLRVGYRGYESGKLMEDEYFQKNIKGALKAGIKVGVYFFSQATTMEEALEEADLVLSSIKGYEIDFPVVFDMEEIAGTNARVDRLTPEEATDIAIAYCQRIAEAGHRPLVYGNAKWLAVKLQPERLTNYHVWLAQYYNQPWYPYQFQIWQYTNTGKVDGIQGNVDLNLCFTEYPQ